MESKQADVSNKEEIIESNRKIEILSERINKCEDAISKLKTQEDERRKISSNSGNKIMIICTVVIVVMNVLDFIPWGNIFQVATP